MRAAVRLCLFFLAAAGFDRLFSCQGWLLGAALFLLLLYKQSAAEKLQRWTAGSPKTSPPDLPAPFDDIALHIHKQREQSKKRKKRLQKFLSYYRALVDAVPDAALVIDQHRRVAGFNKRAQQLLSIDRRLDAGTQIDFLVRGEGINSFWAQMQERDTLIVRLLAHDDLRLEFMRLPLDQGNTLLIARDVTEILRLDSKRKAFIDNASHELKTPLTVILGFLEVMRGQDDVPAKWVMPVEEMYKHAQRMRMLAEDMLRLASLENPDKQLQKTDVQLQPLLDDIAAAAMAAYPEQPVRVLSAENLTTSADAGVLHSMIANLATNAQLHAKSEKPIELSASRQDGEIIISVRDYGIGISSADAHRITERFYRVDKNRHNAKGSGLGLAIVKHGAEAHGGRLVITSEIGSGSTFAIHLPA